MDEVDSFHEWLFKMLGTLQGFDMGKFVMVLWAIWKQKNEQLWSSSCLSTEQDVYAAWFDGNTRLGLGMILCDDEGIFLCCQTCFVAGLFKVNEGEALALLKALKWVRNLGYQKAYFEMDAKTETTALVSLVQDFTEFGDILNNYKSVLTEETNLRLCGCIGRPISRLMLW
ncbi:hypothetical protein PTKIN_Ptkin03bG0096400 [Pterospermum kingtungense]